MAGSRSIPDLQGRSGGMGRAIPRSRLRTADRSRTSERGSIEVGWEERPEWRQFKRQETPQPVSKQLSPVKLDACAHSQGDPRTPVEEEQGSTHS